jgi:PKD repeat protein
VTGPGGSNTRTIPGMITVTVPAPVAGFTATPTSGVPPLRVHFTNTATGSITSRSWAFGDGGTSTVASPNHTFALPGIYTVIQTVRGPGGANTASRMIAVGGPVVANFTASVTSGTAPLSVDFTDTSTGVVVSGSWSFGDGIVSSLPNPNHVYTVPGNYTVSRTVTGPIGSDTRTVPQMISVMPRGLLLGVPLPGTAGVPNTVTVTGVTPGAVVHLLGSRRLASQPVPGGVSRTPTGLTTPVIVAKGKAAGTTATLRFDVDPSLLQHVYHLQAVDTASGTVSNIVTHTY